MCVLNAFRVAAATITIACALVLMLVPTYAQDGGTENLGVPRKRDVNPASRQNANSKDQANPSDTSELGEPAEGPDGEDQNLPAIRRRPPRTDEDEQRFKRFKFQTDPFLTVWDFSYKPNAYNPGDWLTPSAGLGLSQYIAQDNSGAVVGSLSIAVAKVSDAQHGEMLQITMHHRLGRAKDTVLLVDFETFTPIRFEEWDLGRNTTTSPDTGNTVGISHLAPPRFLARYSFDRVDIEREQGDMISRARFRQLPYSFDKASMVWVARNLNFRFPNWPFQTPVTDPAMGAKIILSIPKPTRSEVLSAEPKTYNCFELKLQFGGVEETWWIERIPPNRLVKFTQNGLVFTLSQYLEHL